MSNVSNKTIKQRLKWWWSTRIVGFFRIKVKAMVSHSKQDDCPNFEFEQKASAMPEPDEHGITVILTAYRRTEYLEEQIKAVKKQTKQPTEIWVWYNDSPEQQKDISSLVDRVIVSNSNFLFWGRFGLGNLARTGYVAFFDDDILPQPKWLENCLNTLSNGYDGILGGSGVILPAEGGYSSKNKAGWNGKQLNQAATVDLVGHAWFMRKAHLQYMWREEPHSWNNGEDIHLSYMALKHGGIQTFVPPHPENDMSLWSCRPDFGKIVGRKKVATFKSKGHKNIRSEIVDAYRDDGWVVTQQLVNDNEKTFSGDLIKFNNRLKDEENFSLVRFGDGEMIVINGESIDLSQKCNGEHKYSPGNDVDETYRKILTESLSFQSAQYYIGLPCRCCVGDDHCDQLREQSQQKVDALTWANIFVNSNYPLFLETTVKQFDNRIINIVCHEKANVNGLPFKVFKDFRIGANAWTADFDRLNEELSLYISKNNNENEVFLFCAGVLSNMLIYKLTKDYPNNTYIDLGSVFDSHMDLGKTRKYLKGSKRRLKKVCVW